MLKVVVIDGNSISRGLLTSVLAGGGHLVVGDSNVSVTGIARMVKLKPQLICINIDLDQAAGDRYAVLDQIRRELPKAIVFLTSDSFDEEGVRSAQAHGVKGFIVKPFNTARVLDGIRTVVLKVVQEIKKVGPAAPGGAAEPGN